MAKPKGRPVKFDHSLKLQVDEDTKAWLAAVAATTGTTEAVVVRSILKTCRARSAAPAPRELEGYVDAEVVNDDPYARAEAAAYAGRPETPFTPVPRRQTTGPRTRQADVRAD